MARSIKNLVAAVLVSISFYLAWFIAYPKYEATNQLKTVIVQKSALLTSREVIIDRINKIESEYENKLTEIERLSLVVPNNKSVSEFITALEEITRISGSAMESLRISSGQGAIESGYNVLSFEISLESNYVGFLNLLKNFEQHIRLIDIMTFSLGIAERDEGDTGSTSLNIQILGNTYFFLGE